MIFPRANEAARRFRRGWRTSSADVKMDVLWSAVGIFWMLLAAVLVFGWPALLFGLGLVTWKAANK